MEVVPGRLDVTVMLICSMCGGSYELLKEHFFNRPNMCPHCQRVVTRFYFSKNATIWR